jgi:hypothetical protein
LISVPKEEEAAPRKLQHNNNKSSRQITITKQPTPQQHQVANETVNTPGKQEITRPHICIDVRRIQ